jgi:sporulation protein YlmC with PRC-barrel domain
MLHTYDYEQLQELSGHEVMSEDGTKVGYIDLVFRDVDSGEPEWLGIWDGLPDTKPRVLVPVRGVEVDRDVVRVPWSADVIHDAPSYEPPHNLTVGQEQAVDIDAETERSAYAHYGIDPATPREGEATVVSYRMWRIQMF